MTVDDVLAAHAAAGHRFTAAGVGSFALDHGEGETVVLLHGLPTSSFLYRRVVPSLAARGLRAIAFDLPGLGLADRSLEVDHSIAGLATFAAAAVDVLGLDRFHLVVHDAGGPVGFELASRMPDRIRSLTVLNTLLGLGRTPFPGEVYGRFADRFAGPLTSPRLFRELMLRVGIADASAVPDEEIDAHRRLLLDPDGGAAYLAIMGALRSHPPVPRPEAVDTRSVPYPVDVMWGARDPILPLRRHGWRMLEATGLPWLTAVPAKHYLQEDQPEQVAEFIARNVARAVPSSTPAPTSTSAKDTP